MRLVNFRHHNIFSFSSGKAIGGILPPPPPPPLGGVVSYAIVSTTGCALNPLKLTTKMKTLNWTKVTRVDGNYPSLDIDLVDLQYLKKSLIDDSIWKEINATIRVKPPVSLRLQQIEELFCMKPTTTSSSTKSGGIGNSNRPMTLCLLDSKRSLAVNIFLKQFKIPIADIVDRIHRCDESFFTTEHLNCLQKILPDADEVITSDFRYFVTNPPIAIKFS